MIFLHFIFWTLTITLKLSAIRWIQMVLYWPKQNEWSFLFETLWMGYRFDLLIVGFWLLPLVVFLLFRKILVGRTLDGSKLMRLYLGFSWLMICALYFRDLVYFDSYQEHMWLESHQSSPFLTKEVWQNLKWWQWLWMGIVTVGLIRVGTVRFDVWVLKLRDVSFLSVVLILLWTTFIARGSLDADHLRRNDCNYAVNATMKSFCMNPIYMFTKSK